MAMNKKEKAYVEKLEAELAGLKLASVAASAVPKMLPPPTGGYGSPPGPELTRGFVYNLHSLKTGYWDFMQYAASKSVSHITSRDKAVVDKWCQPGSFGGGSRDAISLYPTKKDALIAARQEFAQWAGGVVAKLDKEIEAAS